MMTIYKNDPKYKIFFMSIIHPYFAGIIHVGIVKIRMVNKNTKSHFLQILIKSIQSGIKSVYDRG